MVESIKPPNTSQAQFIRNSSASSRTDPGSSGDTEQKIRSSSSAKRETVSVELDSANSFRKLAKNAPIDIELVTEIRQRVADGQYPIDATAIAEKMFSSIKDG
jgi:flagellar biosynthesis anti-sigma factor FlgM